MQEKLKKMTLIEQIKERFKEQIADGYLKPGQRIDSTRALIKKLKISHITAAAALKELKEEGWIESKVGSGSFVSDAPPIESYLPVEVKGESKKRNGKNVVYFFLCGNRTLESGSYHSEVLCRVQDAAEVNSWHLKFAVCSDPDAVNDAMNGPAALGIVYSTSSAIEFPHGTVPAIAYGMSPKHLNSNCVYPDNFEGGYIAGSRLFEKGHARIVYVSALPDPSQAGIVEYRDVHFKQRYYGLVEALDGFGLTAPPLVKWNIHDENTRREVTELLNQVKNGVPDAPTALVVGNKAMAAEIYMVAVGMGLKIPDDLSLISFIERSESRSAYITTIDFSREEMADQIVGLLDRLASVGNLPGVTRIMVPMFFTDDSSVKDLKAD